MESYKLPPSPGFCEVVYFLCGPLSALGFVLGGWCGFLLVLLLCLLLLCVRRLVPEETPRVVSQRLRAASRQRRKLDSCDHHGERH